MILVRAAELYCASPTTSCAVDPLMHYIGILYSHGIGTSPMDQLFNLDLPSSIFMIFTETEVSVLCVYIVGTMSQCRRQLECSAV